MSSYVSLRWLLAHSQLYRLASLSVVVCRLNSLFISHHRGLFTVQRFRGAGKLTRLESRVSWVRIPPRAVFSFPWKKVVLGVVVLFASALPWPRWVRIPPREVFSFPWKKVVLGVIVLFAFALLCLDLVDDNAYNRHLYTRTKFVCLVGELP